MHLGLQLSELLYSRPRSMRPYCLTSTPHELDEVTGGEGPGATAVVPFRPGAAMDVTMHELLVLLPPVSRDPVTQTAMSGQGDHRSVGVVQRRDPRRPGNWHLQDRADRPGRASGDDRRLQLVQQLCRRPGAITGLAGLGALRSGVSTAMGIDLSAPYVYLYGATTETASPVRRVGRRWHGVPL